MNPLPCTDLYPAVAPVRHDDVAVDVHGHPCGGVELAVAFAVGAELQQEFPLRVEHLRHIFLPFVPKRSQIGALIKHALP